MALPTTMPANNLEVVSKLTLNTYTAKFYMDGTLLHTLNVKYTFPINYPSLPSKDGYTVTGWECQGLDNNPTTMPAQDLTFHAILEADVYTVKYYSNGKVVDTQTYNYGDTINYPALPTETGYNATKWEAEGYDTLPTTMPAKDITVHAVLEAVSYTLNYKLNVETYDSSTGGSKYVTEDYDSTNYAYGQAITYKAKPSRSGYTASDWEV